MIYRFDKFAVDTTAFELLTGGERIDAQPQVIELLIFLLQNQNRIVSRDEIFGQVWKNRVVSDAALSSRIKTLRQVLGDDGETQKYIRTIHGRGFRFVGRARSEETTASVLTDRAPASTVERPRTRYVNCNGVHIAFQTFGNGPVNLVFVPGFVSHIENYWDCPQFEQWLNDLAELATVTMFDKRGTGLSDSVSNLPGMDERMDDVRAVMDAVGWPRAYIMGISEGGSLASLFAATHPERCLGLILYGSFSRFSAWFPNEAALNGLFNYIETAWGSGQSLPNFAPSVGTDPGFVEWWGKFERLGATPGAAIELMTMNSKIDISDILPSIQVSTIVIHPRNDVLIDFDAGEYLATNIPSAQLVVLEGKDHLPWSGESTNDITRAIAGFISDGAENSLIPDTVLTTILCVGTVSDKYREDRSGNDWQEAARQSIVQRVRRFRGRTVRDRGNFKVATFDGPARAMHCALDIIDSLSAIGLTASGGIHIGEITRQEEDADGPPIDAALQLVEQARSGQLLTSSTVKDLAAGSGLVFKRYEMRDSDHAAGLSVVYSVGKAMD